MSNKEILEESERSMDEKHKLDDFERAPESVAPQTGGWKTSPYILGKEPDLELRPSSIDLFTIYFGVQIM